MKDKLSQVPNNPLAKNHGTFSLVGFAMPTIIMMIFMSLYMMVDGAFVSQFVGTTALSAINIVYPLISITVAVGIMIATGGSAVVAKKMGENNYDEARKDFTTLVVLGISIGVIITITTAIFVNPFLKFLGANGELYQYCYDYIMTLNPFVIFAILQMLFQYFFVAAGKPSLGLITVVMGGVSNIVLDYIFIVPMNMGIRGAAIATGIGYCIPALFGLIYFSLSKKGHLYFVRPSFSKKTIISSCLNGSSEMVTNLSTAVTTYLFNITSLKYIGVDGVAAITIILYSQFFMTALFLGYSSGVAPVISYNYGNKNHSQLKKVYLISLSFVAISSVGMFWIANSMSEYIIKIFVSNNSQNVFDLATTGMRLFSFSYLFIGINIFASALFTALENGKVSAIISFLRTFLFIVPCILLLPMIIGANGIWLAMPIAEALAMITSIGYLFKHRSHYYY